MTEGEHGDFMKNMQPIPKTPMYLPFLDPVYMWIKTINFNSKTDWEKCGL